MLACSLLLLSGTGPTRADEYADSARTFEERCADPQVVLCDALDDAPVQGPGIDEHTPLRTLPEALNGKYREWRWCTHNPKTLPVPPRLDHDIKASGTGSLRFTLVGGGKDDAAGYCQINFSPDNTVQFGEGETFYVQFRVRYSCEMLFVDCDPASPDYQRVRRKFRVLGESNSAFKISIINAGDHASLEEPVGSCTNQHLVLIGDTRGVIQGYHSCGWFSGHWGDLGLDARTGRQMIDLQPRSRGRNGMLSACHKSDSPAAPRDDPTRGCSLLSADEWLTFTQQITIGRWSDRVNDPARSSNVKLWVAREGKLPELVFDFDRNLRRPEVDVMKYGKIWLLPYITNKDPGEMHPTASVWYDELIVSRGPIAPAR